MLELKGVNLLIIDQSQLLPENLIVPASLKVTSAAKR